VYDVYGASPDAALRGGVQVPLLDPAMLVPAMATVTEHLGFGVTCNLAYEPPYPFARRMSTLDHLTGGRMGWNIVTGYLDSAARAAGFPTQKAHQDRYALADDYMDVVYALWEQSWDDGAVPRDRAGGLYTNPAAVRRITHTGPHYQLDAMHLCEPSPQRTPVLFQAAASSPAPMRNACFSTAPPRRWSPSRWPICAPAPRHGPSWFSSAPRWWWAAHRPRPRRCSPTTPPVPT
jgi:alkanesulfonate monooxygenase